MSDRRSRRGGPRRSAANRGEYIPRGRGTRGDASISVGGRGGRGVGDRTLRGSNGGRSRGFIPRGRGGRPAPKKWCLLVMKDNVLNEEIEDFLFGLKYKLQERNATFTLDKPIVETDVNKVEAFYRNRANDRLEFCLILHGITQNKAEIEEQLKRPDIPRIFIKDFEYESICDAAKDICELISRDNGNNAEFDNGRGEETVTRPMNERKVTELSNDDSLSDLEILMKLTCDGSFARRLDVPTPRLNTMDVLKLIARASRCNASHYRRSLNELLENLCSSMFWKTTVGTDLANLQFCNEIKLQENQVRIHNLLLFTTTIVIEILRSVESKAKETVVVKSFLSMMLAMPAIRANTVIFDDEIERHENSLNALWHDVVEAKGPSVILSVFGRSKFDRNDTERPPPNNFRDLTIFPSEQEILTTEKPYLRANKTLGSYDSVDHYLDVQFRLLREDFIDPLRKGINSLLSIKGNKRPEIKIYEKVIVFPPVQNKRTGLLTYKIKFDMTHMKKVRWEFSKRFLHGSLLCMSSNNFKTMLFATVVDRNAEGLKKGELDVVFELLPDGKLSFKDEYRMVESSVYFEAYRHVLLALCHIRDDRDMPFPKYFIRCDPKVDSPLYLRAINSELDLTCLVPEKVAGKKSFVCNILRHSTWPTKEMLSLDESQYEALKLALTKELAIIQGPPGTGKTFIGWKIAQVLLENHERWQTSRDDAGPILVVCYTNHALDQFLEGITTFMSERIIRIGGRSKNEKMEKFLLKNVSFDYQLPADLRFRLREENIKKLTIERRIAEISGLMQSLDKTPLSHLALHEIVGNNRLLDQILSNPNRLTLNKDQLLNVWLTSDKQIQKESCLIDFDVLRKLMNTTQFDQVPCMNALFVAKNNFENAYLWLFNSDQRLSVPVPEVANIPSIWDVDELVACSQFSEQDAIFALQQNGNDVNLALQWLTNDFQTLQNEQFDEQAAQRAAATIQPTDVDDDDDDDELFGIELYDENRELDDDEREEREENFGYHDDDYECYNPLQDWQTIGKGGKSEFPQCVWVSIVRAIPFDDNEYRVITHPARPVDPWKLPLNIRWRLYKTWLEQFRIEKDIEIRRYQNDYFEINQRMNEIRNLEKQHIFKKAKVIGMTTTGAAKYQAVLNAVKPKIVIVEEAAEVLESHIVTSLSGGCQHAILIGDHDQLRPSTAVFELAKHYKFDISLFERLINNKFEHAVLKQQHRMRPEIADTLMPHFYKGLCNSASVYEYESVKGIAKNLYFFHHTNQEKQEGDSTSRQNEFEGNMIVGFCKYLFQQGYDATKITILCCYAGQMFYIKKFMKGRLLDEESKGLRVTVVDNYQGEECEIILLSFVRSNNDEKIGFLNIKNRVCVALSRAKLGLFCFGNFEHLAHCAPEMWKEIVDDLKSKSLLGQHLPLICQIHKKDSSIKNYEDFRHLVPEGGCKELCNFRLDCGHVCQKFCHPNDPEHKKVRCVKPCEKKCTAGHSCKKLCWDNCGDCHVFIDKVLPACGHSNRVQCFKPLDKVRCQSPCNNILSCGHKCQETCDPEIHTTSCKINMMKLLPCGHSIEAKCYQNAEDVRCTFKLKKTWPLCNHSAETFCYTDVTKEDCKQPCKVELECEHHCSGDCSSCRNGRFHIQCKELCSKILVCGHECGEKCSTACPPCTKPCEIRCIHSGCVIKFDNSNRRHRKQKQQGRNCGQLCPECQEKCFWECPHFSCKKKCFELCDRPRCCEPCPKKLHCGHPCIGVCGEPCPPVCRECNEEKFKELKIIFFGNEDDDDARFLQLSDCKHIFEVGGFDSYVDHDYQQSVESGEVKLLTCPKCRKPILTSLRFGNVMKRKFADFQNVKRKIRGNLKELDEQRTELVREIDIQSTQINIADKENAGFAYEELYSKFQKYLKNNQIQHLTIEKVARLKNMVDFLPQLVQLSLDVEKDFDPMNSCSVDSAILRNFLSKWFPSFMKGVLIFEQISIYLSNEIAKLSSWIGDCFKVASHQMMDEFSCELRRLTVLEKVIRILKLMAERNLAITEINEFEEIMKILFGKNKIIAELEENCFNLLKFAIRNYNFSLGITEDERKQIVNAMNMRQGHWFKCKNGHIYCITECGGAIEEAQCPECKEIIGGTSHRLRAGNTLASEMDGATRGAYDTAADLNLDLIRRLQLE